MLDVDFASWQIDGEKVEKTDFIFLGSKITVDGDCSRKIKKCLLLGRKAMTNLDSIFKSRDITLLTKAHIVTAMVVFLVVMTDVRTEQLPIHFNFFLPFYYFIDSNVIVSFCSVLPLFCPFSLLSIIFFTIFPFCVCVGVCTCSIA